MNLKELKISLEKEYGYNNLQEENEYSWFIDSILKDTISILEKSIKAKLV